MAKIKDLLVEIEVRKPSTQKNIQRARNLALKGMLAVLPKIPAEEISYHQQNIDLLEAISDVAA
jgi:hypothetical protein